jgi:mannopine transport system permease protein
MNASRLALHAAAWAVVVFLMLPTLVVVPISFSRAEHLQFPPTGFSLRWYQAYFSDPDWLAATWFSAKAGAIAALGATVVGTMTALAMVRGRIVGRKILDMLVVGPVIVPHIALAVALFLVYDRLKLNGTLAGFALAHTVLAAPFAIFAVLAALYRFDADLELAALSCGASRLRAFWHVTLPMILPGVLSGAVFAFIISFDEAVVSFFISDLDGKSLPRKLFEDIDYNLTPVVAAVASLLSFASLAVLVLGHLVGRLAARRGEGSGSKS